MARSITDRMLGAALLDVETYEEVEHDETATGQAALVVLIVAICGAIGAWNAGPFALVGTAAGQLAGWVVWAGLTYFIGTRLFSGTATWGELLRTLGFAQAPGVLALLLIVPLLRWLVLPVMGIWMLVAGVVAIRQALDFSTGKAVFTAVLGWIVIVAVRVAFL
jgi:hypothetical protein